MDAGGRRRAFFAALVAVLATGAACGRDGFDEPGAPTTIPTSTPTGTGTATPTAVPSATWTPHPGMNGWTHRRRIPIDNTGFGGSVSGLPAAVRLDSTFDYTHAAADARDIRFVDDAGTPLPYEIERWNDPTSHKSEVWVRLPDIPKPPSPAPVFWLYYGNSAVSSAASPSQTWSGFNAVWHLGITPASVIGTDLGYQSSTGNADSEGKIARARDFDGTANAEIVIGDTSALDVSRITISTWIYSRDWASGNHRLLQKGNDGDAYMLLRDSNGLRVQVGGNGSLTSNVLPTLNQWHQVAATFDGSSLRIYVDGQQTGSRTIFGNIPTTNKDLSLGAKPGSNTAGDHFDGIIDEVEIMASARSGTWIDAQYRAMNGTLFTVGAEESQ